MKNLILVCFLITSLMVSNAFAQQVDLVKALKDKKLVPRANTQVEVSASDHGKQAISVNGIVWLKEIDFKEGTIEIDIRGNDILQGTFPGVIFHAVDSITFDAVYFRPFNFQATDPVRKIHAVQYVSPPQYTWSFLRETKNGIYEKAVTPAPGANDWFHAMIVVKGKEINVYVNDSKTPSLTVTKLNDRTTGRFGLISDDGQKPGEFANLVVRK